ncbi:preprotein translocase subunit SecE [Sanguibacter gelidistatuariae]|uniref:Protein translocase subunit SecE n=1 Tax=Sanguibacter gelidistatuariae TaxID=1814289 RepID=A0A1G6K8H5_9MICO|nr:preprotein translocase subunit SecE [Sanguibacter gelidistatuariae]SDC27253.1 preprotein translocase subunit SecE [Sanguibacter gelidistatuariae]
MSDSASGAASAEGVSVSGGKSGKKAEQKKANFFARVALFVRQVVAELKKVVVPTRPELINYVVVVIVFVLVAMAFVLVLDFLIGKGVFALFG